MITLCLFLNFIGDFIICAALIISNYELKNVFNSQKKLTSNIGLYLSIAGLIIVIMALIMAILIRNKII